MKGFISIIIFSIFLSLHIGCATNSSNDLEQSDEVVEDATSGPEDEFVSDSESSENFDDEFSDDAQTSAPSETAQSAEQAPIQDDSAIEEELNFEEELADSSPPPAVSEQAPIAQTEIPPAEIAPTEITPTEVPQAESMASNDLPTEVNNSFAPMTESSSEVVKILNIQFKANENGGTVVIDANGPLSYETKANSSNNQFVIDLQNVSLPAKLQRPFNTKDFQGSFASIDAFQKRGSTQAKVIIQMRNEGSEPFVQVEGKSLIVMAAGGPTSLAEQSSSISEEPQDIASKILTSSNLQEFLSGNTTFYGKKISIETNDMDLRDALRFITDESGVNMVISDEVKGKVSLKLKAVPWDQALIVIMRSKRLGYTREGNVLRIAPLADLRLEEEDANRLITAKKTTEALKVRMLPISFAKVEDIERQVKAFLTDRGKVISDSRTSSIVITDIEESISRAVKLVQSLDIAPPQVLIEGKIVEAKDTFVKEVGIRWRGAGETLSLGKNGSIPTNMTPNFGIDGGSSTGNSSFNLDLSIGTLKFLGDINTSFRLYEQKDLVNVLSSPRIMTLHNEKAEISQSSESPIFSTTVSGNSDAATKTVSFKPVKLSLAVTPQISNQGSVIMAVDVVREFLSGVADQATGARSSNSRTAKTKVIVQNGETAVIGGIYQNDTTENESGVPGLKEIPYLGWLFKGKSKTQDKSELLIFLTPRILSKVGGESAPQIEGEL